MAAKRTATKATAKAAATKKAATNKTTTKKAEARAPTASLGEFCAVLGKRVDDVVVATLFAAQKLKPHKTDRIRGEPHHVHWRNDNAGVVVTAEDKVCVAVDVDDCFNGGLYGRVGFGAAREAVADVLGAVERAERFYDTFHVEEHRVVCQFVRGGLVGVRVEPWAYLIKRLARETQDNDNAPAVVVQQRPPLPEPWASTLPSMTALRALLGQPAADTVLATLEARGHLRRESFSEGAMLEDDDASVRVGLDKDGVVDLVNVGLYWCGGYEDGFNAGAVGRKEARERYGAPTHEASSFDIWDLDDPAAPSTAPSTAPPPATELWPRETPPPRPLSLRRQVSYLLGHVMSWQLQRRT